MTDFAGKRTHFKLILVGVDFVEKQLPVNYYNICTDASGIPQFSYRNVKMLIGFKL